MIPHVERRSQVREAACACGGVTVSHVVIARLGSMPAAEQRAWADALSDRDFQHLLLEDPGPGQLRGVAVVDLHADPPVRQCFAAPLASSLLHCYKGSV